MTDNIRIRYYIGTNKHPLVNVELTGAFDVLEEMWNTLDEESKRKYIAEKFLEKSDLAWEVENTVSIEKGERGGQCNRKACGAGPATYYNHSTRMWYCRQCAWDIQDFENTQKNPQMVFSEFWKEPLK